jgi:hypothetical protein
VRARTGSRSRACECVHPARGVGEEFRQVRGADAQGPVGRVGEFFEWHDWIVPLLWEQVVFIGAQEVGAIGGGLGQQVLRLGEEPRRAAEVVDRGAGAKP